ncbi:hypothetical protein BH10CYA1_BH10CYA1_58750 [soil metagenome]
MSAIIGMSFVAAILILFWGLDRAIDLRDEGFSLLCTEHPALCPHPSSFAFFLAKLPQLSPNLIISLRLHHVAMQLCSALLLFLGFKQWISSYVRISSKGALIAILICTLFSSLLCFSIFGATLNYNGVTTFFIVGSEAFLFFGLADTIKVKWMMPLWMVLSGAFLGFGFFAKFSAGIVFYAVTLSTICFLSRSGRISKLVWHFCGFASACAVFFIFLESWSTWLSIFKTMVFDIELSGGGSHGAEKIFDTTILSLTRHRFEVLLVAFTLVCLVVGFTLLKKKVSKLPREQIILIPTLVTAVLILCWLQRLVSMHVLHSSIVYWPVVFIGLSLLICSQLPSTLFAEVSSGNKVFFGLMVLAITPLITSLGTDTPILWHALVDMAPLYLSLGYSSYIVGAELSTAAFTPVALLLMTFVVTVQFVYGYVFFHKEVAPLYLQNQKLSMPSRFVGLRLEPLVANLIRDDFSILTSHGFVEGDPVLGLFDTPGLVYAVGGISPGFGWYGIDPANQPVNDYFLPRLQTKNFERLFLIIKNRANSVELDEHTRGLLRSAGIEYPRDFEFIGKSFQPYTYGGKTCHFFIRRRNIIP